MPDEPVKKRTRKTTTKKVVSKDTGLSSSKAVSPKLKSRGLSLKFVLLTILVLFLASGGAFYIGYSAEGAIDVNNRLSSSFTAVEGENGETGTNTNPPPLKERPKLEPANIETPTQNPEPSVEGVATSTDESVNNEEESVSTDGTETENSDDSASSETPDTINETLPEEVVTE